VPPSPLGWSPARRARAAARRPRRAASGARPRRAGGAARRRIRTAAQYSQRRDRGLLADIHFDYDKAELRDGDRQILARNAETLKKFDFLKIKVEGHCDERGSVEYNLALGQRRATAAHDYLVSLGVSADRLQTVSYGKEVPLCQESTEECWARNRRDHFAVVGKTRGR